jgi:uncharacterized protein (TIGR04255 family)
MFVQNFYDDNIKMNLGCAILGNVLLKTVSFNLEIDVYRDTELPLRMDDVWGIIDGFRTVKNTIFESAITDEVRKLLG